MNLGRQIHTLLKRQAAVYVNRLGVFRRIHTPATFDAKRRVFLPPITFIEFESSGADGYDFVTYIQQVNQLDRREADALVDEAVGGLLDKLNQVGHVNLDNLGQLVSYGNSYVFKPLDLSGFNYTPVEDEFHVQEDNVVAPAATVPTEDAEIASPPVEEIEKEEEPIELAPATEVVEDAVDEVEEEVVDIAETVEPENRKSTSAYVYAIVAVVALALLGGLYYYSTQMQTALPVVQQKIDVVPLDTIPQDTLVAIVPTDSLDNNNVVDTTESIEVEKVQVSTPDPRHKYTIIIGTHKTLAQAYEEAEAFNKDGHKSVKVITPNLAKNLKRVVWDTYATKEERDSALRYVKKHIKTDAWPDVIR